MHSVELVHDRISREGMVSVDEPAQASTDTPSASSATKIRDRDKETRVLLKYVICFSHRVDKVANRRTAASCELVPNRMPASIRRDCNGMRRFVVERNSQRTERQAFQAQPCVLDCEAFAVASHKEPRAEAYPSRSLRTRDPLRFA